jgi:hypothetical protein
MSDDIDRVLQFKLEEFKCLRTEIMDHITAQRHLELACIVAMAAMYSFLLANKADVPWWPWLIPVAFPLFCLARTWAYTMHVIIIAEYLLKVEESIAPKIGFWETFLRDKRMRRPRRDYRFSLMSYTFILSYVVLLAGAIIVSVVAFYRYYGPSTVDPA